jgi:hypothetical protein
MVFMEVVYSEKQHISRALAKILVSSGIHAAAPGTTGQTMMLKMMTKI